MATETLEIPNSGAANGSTTPRRLSATKAVEDALGATRAATVVVPASRRPSVEGEASLVASTIELARRQLEGLTTADIASKIPEKTEVTDAFAFAFDIDGVLIKGGKPIPAAVEAMKMLNGQNNRGIKV